MSYFWSKVWHAVDFNIQITVITSESVWDNNSLSNFRLRSYCRVCKTTWWHPGDLWLLGENMYFSIGWQVVGEYRWVKSAISQCYTKNLLAIALVGIRVSQSSLVCMEDDNFCLFATSFTWGHQATSCKHLTIGQVIQNTHFFLVAGYPGLLIGL